MCQTIQAEPGFDFTKVPGFMDRVYNSWQIMSKGAHPSGVGIRQTEGETETKHLIGATYHRELALAGFDIGLFTVATLLPLAMRLTKPEIGPWSDEWEQVSKDVGAWREAHEDAIRAAEGPLSSRDRSATTPPRPVPPIRESDLDRCRKLFRRRYEQMNRMVPRAAIPLPAGSAEGTTSAVS